MPVLSFAGCDGASNENDGGTDATTCPTGLTTCAGTCSDTSKDPVNCGACGTACSAGQVCSKGSCALTCATGTTACGQSCTNLSSDNANCGACNNACSQGKVCAAGSCNTSCQPNETMCTPDGGAAYCANTQTDNVNCGSCGNACPQGQVCSAGKCQTSCQPNETMCTPDGGAAYCANTQTDNVNCGSCGNPCPQGQVCSGGQCQTTCQPSETMCTPDAGAPYCASTQTDNVNCGACGKTCPSASACVNGSCSFASCSAALTAGVTTSGIYQISPNGVAPFAAYCDMTTAGGGWTLIVLTNGNVAGFPDVTFNEAKNTSANLNGAMSADLDTFDFFMGTTLWNAAGPGGKMLFKVGDSKSVIKDIVEANFNVYGNSERITWSSYTALQGGIPNIDYNNNGYLQAKDKVATGSIATCVDELSPGVGLWGPWFYQGCSNVSPWCTGHGDCNGLPVRMQWRNQGSYTTATASSCSNHGEIYVR